MQQVTVRVPASTSNLGPGFDCLGVALRIYNDVTMRRGGRQADRSDGARSGRAFFARTKCGAFPFSCECGGRRACLPRTGQQRDRAAGRDPRIERARRTTAWRAKKSSSFAPNWKAIRTTRRRRSSADSMLRTARQRQRFSVSAVLKFVLLVPDFEVRTSEARALLPAANRTQRSGGELRQCLRHHRRLLPLVDYANLRGAFRDHLAPAVPQTAGPVLRRSVVAAAEKAGALGGFLSGSGSTIAAVTLDTPKNVAAAMLAAAQADPRDRHHDGRQSRRAPASVPQSAIRNPHSPMSQRSENLEQFAIDVILERRHGARATMLRGVLYGALVRLRAARAAPLVPLPAPHFSRAHARLPRHQHRQPDRRRHRQNADRGEIRARAADGGRRVAILSRGYKSVPQPARRRSGSASSAEGRPLRRASSRTASRSCSIRSPPATSPTCSRTT